jgi:hypothetical protein
MVIGRPGFRAEELISEFGITSPGEIDIEAIAFDQGIEVAYEDLHGCEATLVGFGNRAIATISPSSSRGRERFSIAHEVGHWSLHRGRSFRCRTDDVAVNYASDNHLEKEADQFASHMLMPRQIFLPAIRSTKNLGLNDLQLIATDFQVSLQAAAIRMATLDTLPIIVACYSTDRRIWFNMAAHIPKRWELKCRLDEDSFAYEVLHAGKPCTQPRKQSADAWFENDDADQYELFEQAIPSVSGQVLVLLYLSDPEMCEAGYDPNLRFASSKRHLR